MNNWHLFIAGTLFGIGLMLLGAIAAHFLLFQGFNPLWRVVLNT
jgi:hypothetical protein